MSIEDKTMKGIFSNSRKDKRVLGKRRNSSTHRRPLRNFVEEDSAEAGTRGKIHDDCIGLRLVDENSRSELMTRCELCKRLSFDVQPDGSASTKSDEKLNETRNDEKCWGENFRCPRTMSRNDVIAHSRSGLEHDNRSLRCASSVVRWNSADLSRPRRFYTLGTRDAFGWIIPFVLLTILTSVVSAELLTFPVAEVYRNSSINAKREVCQSIDIRNSVSEFSRLEGCRVVEGFVQILLIDHADDTALANLSYPDLIEITGYLVLYRVNGLRSVGRLFPNLTVIRGHSLFINYALVAFEMMHLQEIGLHSLTDILRGSVRFEKNPALCYVDTIDWDLIAKAGRGEHVISGNKPRNGCPVCDKHCPSRSTKPDDTLCWNRQHCQKVCDRKCKDRACTSTGMCCHPSCLGGCTGELAQHCTACREVSVAGNQCVQRCPSGTYEFMNRRCIQENECRRMKKPPEAIGTIREYPYKPFKDSCIMECPAGWMDEDRNGLASCKQCDGHCLRECAGANVNSIASAQKLRGCTHISGSLEIQIRGGKNIVKELEDSLNSIEVIDGYLKIVRSFPLISLNFFKRLKVIKGNYLDNNKYTLSVLDNQNLQELWDWGTHPSIKILSRDGPAKVFFHFNPKLCLQQIETLRQVANLAEFTDLEVAPNSNGDKVACNVTELKAEVTKKNSEAALIQWEAFNHDDTRSLLGYVFYFIEAPSRNVTMYDGRDACGGDGWRVDDVSAADDLPSIHITGNRTIHRQPHYLTHILTQLKPYTQYAFYVKTYTIATERSGAQSKVQYFTTLPDAPSQPRSLSIWSNASSELVISWNEPARKNGNLTHYKIIGHWDRDDPAFVAQRNYCDEPMLLPEKKSMSEMAEEERKKVELESEYEKSPPKGRCDCSSRKPEQSSELEKEISSSIAFEDALHNAVYVKRTNSRRRRDIDAVPWKRDTGYAQEKDYIDPSENKIENGTYVRFAVLVPATNKTFVMRNLRHFAEYYIEIIACREKVFNETQNYCSTKAVKAYRTLPIESADNIPPSSFKLEKIGGNNSYTFVKLQWDEPPQPNGLIITYQIEYKRLDIQNIQPTQVCITRHDFIKADYSYILKDLAPGNYSVKVRATSLAGSGADSETKYFYIEEFYTSSKFWIAFWSISSITLLTLSLVTFYVCKRKFMRNVPSMRLIATVNPEYVSTVYIPDEWEVPRKKIQLLRELGNGSFGMVYEGLAKDVVKSKPEVRCAVKTVNENATDRERIEFLNEASVMKAFNTYHVVRLLGVVSQGQPTLVVMELMVNGDLKTYLRSHRPDQCENFMKQPPTLKRILRMAVEIADGMAYLSAKKFVHRDLAARNCMVAEDLTVKIGDFGMTRDIYETDYYRKGTKGLLPVRWMAPESLKDGVFTSFSDVWSYGVVLWEMVTLASQPYQGLSNDQVLRYVIDGGVMERPENCPDSMYTLMRRTWNHKSNRRPTFIDIATMLLSEVDVEGFDRVSFYHSPEGIEARNQNNSHSPHNDKDLELSALQDLREDEGEDDEDSPLRQDFGDFASIEPSYLKNNSNSRYGGEPYGENSKVVTKFHDLNSSKIPLKAGFDDFDGVSAGSLNSSKDTLDFPFVEDSLKSVKVSPSNRKKSSSRGSLSLKSMKQQPRSPASCSEIAVSMQDSPGLSLKSRKNSPDYENHTPEVLSMIEGKEPIKLRINFPPIDDIDVVDNSSTNNDKCSQPEYTEKSETLNNGFISGTTT
ncbi:insulin-like receptor [Venturia canescens]|uniref:insulin-like receptor n=1 Tax=Venturia canescens TaxID=32260 RepID=UPI001C9C1307|nr:insulin-like receptor [Venturia canescens]XP_043280652.1 insulin-like receptor [Venturia canescens]XP_043280653.1 insulin-like receptor [Venturia canescens]XP_043280654.1 insulin-like receptor [Venturia canescens]XP_043280655.1 insulin-like receptor [Venturia canescens]